MRPSGILPLLGAVITVVGNPEAYFKLNSGYGYEGLIEKLRTAKGDVGHLDDGHHIFLDYAGTGLYTKSQARSCRATLFLSRSSCNLYYTMRLFMAGLGSFWDADGAAVCKPTFIGWHSYRRPYLSSQVAHPSSLQRTTE